MPQKTQRKKRDPGSVGFDSLQFVGFDNVASIGAGVAGSTVQARLPLPCSCKIMAVAVSYSAIENTTGNHKFNIAVGSGSYETGGTAATGTYTITGAPATGQNNTYTIAGTAVVCPQTTGNTVTQQAAADIIVINADPTVSKIVTASNVAGVITITANAKDSTGNAITTTAASSGGDTLTANQAHLTGGVDASAITVGTPESFETTGVFNFAAAGNALFATDQGLTAAANTPQVFNVAAPDQFDVIYQQGQMLTLRVLTPTTVGSITNLKVMLLLKPYDVLPTRPYPSDLAFTPANSIA